ncbi:hypothetical protein HB364_14565 [Pseudoflavitalea sp. X16]|uniref:hypothetical protein n=1 Tax=Paraflavitalea devenefica TaxID=2716334 RepID=UPI001420C263|nr:hypothetical protein [Paraflavitalea devenefica]NII26311.1 hypothetical protein [Paraflavitalea devenefica]
MSKRSIAIIVLLLLIAGGIVTWSIYKRRIVKNEVAKTIADKSNNLYGIKTGSLDIDEVAGSLTATNLELAPDSNVYNQLSNTSDAPSVLAKISIPSLTVAGVKTPRALLNSEIDGRKVVIHSPRIELFFTGKGKDSLKKVPDKEMYRQILGNLELIKIDTLSVVNATIITREWKTGQIRMQFDSVFIDLFRIAVDSLHDKDTTRILFAEQVLVKCKKARWSSKNKLYQYEVHDIHLNSSEKKLSMNRFTINPALPEQKFLQQFKYANDRFDVDIRQIRLASLNVSLLLVQQDIAADSLVAGASNVRIYRDLSFPHDGKNRVGTYPNQLIMKLPIDLAVKKATFHNCFIEYKERNGKSGKSGKVQFHKAVVSVANLTNHRKLLVAKSMQVQFRAQFLDKAPVRALINFYPDGGRFTIEGEMGGIEATDLNQLTEPMGLTTIEKGTLRGMKFNFSGTDYTTDGRLTIFYNDLRIALLQKDSTDNSLNKKGLVSMLANIKVKNDNPGKKEEVRVADVHYKRDTHKSFFNLVWKSIFTGVKQTVGME